MKTKEYFLNVYFLQYSDTGTKYIPTITIMDNESINSAVIYTNWCRNLCKIKLMQYPDKDIKKINQRQR